MPAVRKRAKPAVPFGGKYHIIDFTLSNCVNSGLYDIGVLTQFSADVAQPAHRHRPSVGPRPFARRHPAVAADAGMSTSDWYRGTADAIYQNLLHLKRRRVEEVLILSGDHIYKMDYNVLYAFHRANRAMLTVAVTEVPEKDVSQSASRSRAERPRDGVQEQPGPGHEPARLDGRLPVRSRGRSSAISSGRREPGVVARLRQGHPAEDGRAQRRRVRVPLPELLADVGTLDSYYDANLAFSAIVRRSTCTTPAGSSTRSRPTALPVRVAHDARVHHSMLANGCRIGGEVVNSVLFPGVVVSPGAVVRDSIVMHDTIIGPGAVLDRAIVDKEAHIGAEARVGHGDETPPTARALSIFRAGSSWSASARAFPRTW